MQQVTSKFLLEIQQICEELMNSDLQIINEEERLRPPKSEVNRLFGDNKLIFKLTNWKPKYIGIDGFKKVLKQLIGS